jgi:hypothetical protein
MWGNEVFKVLKKLDFCGGQRALQIRFEKLMKKGVR